MERLYSLHWTKRTVAGQVEKLAFVTLLLLAFSFALEVLHPFVTLAEWQFSTQPLFES